MAGTKREPREIAKERVNAVLKNLRKLRDAAKTLGDDERRAILDAVQRELVALDGAFNAPRDAFEYAPIRAPGGGFIAPVHIPMDGASPEWRRHFSGGAVNSVTAGERRKAGEMS
jgi:hypothetical protein